MAALADKLTHHAPSVWLEVGPPRGVNPEPLLRRLSALVGHVDAINLTDNALGKVKMSSIAFGTIIKLRLGLPVVVNLSCRDRNRFALKSDLLGAVALGIDAVVALTGDKIPPDDPSGARAVHDLDAFALLRMVADLNRGDTGEGKALLKKLPEIFAGAVANPNRKNIVARIRYAEAQGRGRREIRHHAAGVRGGHRAPLPRTRQCVRAEDRVRNPAGQARVDGRLHEEEHRGPRQRRGASGQIRRDERGAGAAALDRRQPRADEIARVRGRGL